MCRLYTVGHDAKPFEKFVQLLKLYGIEVLIDIRRYPQSKLPWFCRDFLENELPKHGIEYLCYPQLGALGIARKIASFNDITCIDSPMYRAYITHILDTLKHVEQYT